jgi:DNA-binding PadR family transcriptional regulator
MDDRRLPTKAVLILATLAEGYRHGYAIRKAIEARTGGEVDLGVTTLYRLLRQLLAAKLVEESAERPEARFDDERRRYFRITAEGRKALRGELQRMERVLEAVRGPLPSRARP